MKKLKYKVGDKVTIKSKHWMETCPHLRTSDGSIYSEIEGEDNCIANAMRVHAGRTTKVMEVIGNEYYKLEVDGYNWYDWMLEIGNLENYAKALDIGKEYWLVSRESEGDYHLDRVPLTPTAPRQVTILGFNGKSVILNFFKGDIKRSVEFYTDPTTYLDRFFVEERDAIQYWNHLIDLDIEEFTKLMEKNINHFKSQKIL